MLPWISFEIVLGYLDRYKYLSMFAILFLCGFGLPIPEEVTLISSGILVGWKQANFYYASIACVTAILAGDSIIFFLGHHYGQAFLSRRFMRRIFPPKRQEFAREFFNRRRNKGVFFARFFAVVRIGVYFYAGTSGMKWWKFLLLDFLGAMISGPTSILLGKFAAQQFADSPEEALARAQEWSRRFHYWIWGAIAVVAIIALFFWWRRRRRARATSSGG